MAKKTKPLPPQPKLKDLPVRDTAPDPKGGKTRTPGGPVPIPYPN